MCLVSEQLRAYSLLLPTIHLNEIDSAIIQVLLWGSFLGYLSFRDCTLFMINI